MYRAALVIAALSYIELSGKACPLWGHVCWFVVSGGWEMPLAFRTVMLDILQSKGWSHAMIKTWHPAQPLMTTGYHRDENLLLTSYV